MSYQTIKERLNSLSSSKKQTNLPNSTTLQNYYNMQRTAFQEIQRELEQYKAWLNIAKKKEPQHHSFDHNKIEVTPIKKKINIPYTKEKILEILENSGTLIQKTKEEMTTSLYHEALLLNNLSMNTQDLEEKEIYKEEIKQILQKIEIVKQYIPTIKQQSKEKRNIPKNQLIFFSHGNRINILENLEKEISPLYYPDFYLLLQSIQNGTWKGYKNLVGKNFSQVSSKFARIYFIGINANHYLILSGLQKDFYSSKYYREELNRLEKICKNAKNIYQSLIENPEFIIQQNQILEQIYTLIKKGEKKDESSLKRSL